MNTGTPLHRVLTSARLDREANPDRDYAAVADALHYDTGLPAGAAIALALETFREGATVREWWNRAGTLR